jgi:AcrR family transcriptional regulator
MADCLSTPSISEFRGSTSATDRNRSRTREDLLAAATALLLRGQEPTMRAVSVEAGVGERTVYRYFANRQQLANAVQDDVRSRVGVPLCASVDELENYVADLFGAFEANRGLTVAMVTSPATSEDLRRSRSDNLRALTRLLEDGFPEAPTSEIASAAAGLRTVLSGAGWVYQRESCGLAPEAVVGHGRWMVRTVLDRLRSSGPGQRT